MDFPMILSFVFMVIGVQLPAQTDASNGNSSPGCRRGAVSIGGQCLRFSTDIASSWSEAIEACSEQNGQLASLKDPHAVMEYAKSTYERVGFWVGGSDIVLEGTWTWHTGEPIVGLPWSGPACGHGQQPDNQLGHQDCLVANWCGGGYDDQNCDRNPQRYICEYGGCNANSQCRSAEYCNQGRCVDDPCSRVDCPPTPSVCGPACADGHCCCCQEPKTGCTLDGKDYVNGSLTNDRCIQYQCIDGAWEYHATDKICGHCLSQGNTQIITYANHWIDCIANHYCVQSKSYQFIGSGGPYSFTQQGLATPSDLGVQITFGDENRITNVLYAETGITVEFVSPGPDYEAKILVDGKKIQLRHGPMTQHHLTVGTSVWLSYDSPIWPPIGGGNILIVGSQGLAVSIWAYQGYAAHVNSYAMPSMKTQTSGLCDVFTRGLPLPENYTMQDGEVTSNINDFTESWKTTPACSCAWRVVIELPISAGCYITDAAPTGNACHCTVIDPLPNTSAEPICVGTLVPCKDPKSPNCIKPGTGKPSCEEGVGDCRGYPLQLLNARG